MQAFKHNHCFYQVYQIFIFVIPIFVILNQRHVHFLGFLFFIHGTRARRPSVIIILFESQIDVLFGGNLAMEIRALSYIVHYVTLEPHLNPGFDVHTGISVIKEFRYYDGVLLPIYRTCTRGNLFIYSFIYIFQHVCQDLSFTITDLLECATYVILRFHFVRLQFPRQVCKGGILQLHDFADVCVGQGRPVGLHAQIFLHDPVLDALFKQEFREGRLESLLD